MIEVPLGKALVAIEVDLTSSPIAKTCAELGCDIKGCTVNAGRFRKRHFSCDSRTRADGKNVIFKLVDYPPQLCKYPMKMCKDEPVAEEK